MYQTDLRNLGWFNWRLSVVEGWQPRASLWRTNITTTTRPHETISSNCFWIFRVPEDFSLFGISVELKLTYQTNLWNLGWFNWRPSVVEGWQPRSSLWRTNITTTTRLSNVGQDSEFLHNNPVWSQFFFFLFFLNMAWSMRTISLGVRIISKLAR